MYDTVSKTFFYNSGTGDFIAGRRVRPGLPDNILIKTTTLYHKNTPNVDGLQLLNGILNHQKTEGSVVLNRIRVDIGNVSGSITELLQYSGMSGFNDEGEEQNKPRLVGTWTVNDWYTQDQLNQARQAFDGLTIVGNPNYLINFDNMAVQVLDDTKPNYNPGFAVALNQNRFGVTLELVPTYFSGRWFITKAQAAAITNFGDGFKRLSSLVDTNNIIDGGTYNFDLKELYYFTSLTFTHDLFYLSTATNLGLPPQWKNLNFEVTGLQPFPNGVVNLYITNIENYLNLISRNVYHPFRYEGSQHHVFLNDVEITEVDSNIIPNNITTIQAYSFCKCPITRVELPDNITTLDVSCFEGISATSIYLNNVTTIKQHALDSVTNVTFKNPNRLTSIYGSGLKNVPYSDRLVENIEYLGDTNYGDGDNQGSPFIKAHNMIFPSIIRLSVEVFIDNSTTITTLGEHLSRISGNGALVAPVHILATTPPTFGDVFTPIRNTAKIYVGDGSSAAHDDAILADYVAASNWAPFSSQLDTWYNYLHPTT